MKKYPSTENEVRLESHLHFYRDLLKEKRAGFLSQRLQNESNKLRYLTFDELFKGKFNKLPNYQNPIVLSRDCNEFFQQKVTSLIQRFDNSIPFSEPTCQHHWSEFLLLSQLEVERSLNRVSNSTAPHVVPAVLLKFLINCFSDTFTELFNCVLSHGVFPSSLKQGVIVPLHKTDDENNFGNYRPVTNTLLLSKVIEIPVLSQMKSYFNKNGLWPRFQSAYRQNNSTESSVLY